MATWVRFSRCKNYIRIKGVLEKTANKQSLIFFQATAIQSKRRKKKQNLVWTTFFSVIYMTLHILQNNSYNTEPNLDIYTWFDNLIFQGKFQYLCWVKLISFFWVVKCYLNVWCHTVVATTQYHFKTSELRLWAGSSSALQHTVSFCESKNNMVLTANKV